MPRRGLEPPRDVNPTSTSSWRVCQFRHLGSLHALSATTPHQGGKYTVVQQAGGADGCLDAAGLGIPDQLVQLCLNSHRQAILKYPRDK